MAEENDYSSIGPLNAAAQKDAFPLVGTILLAIVVSCAAIEVVGLILNEM